MADYYNIQQVAQILGIAEATISELQNNGFLQPTIKDGRPFLSSQQAHRLRTAVRWARRDRIDLQKAFAKVEERWLAHTSATKD
jgi:DNA-binding transcriptional MerR regulator